MKTGETPMAAKSPREGRGRIHGESETERLRSALVGLTRGSGEFLRRIPVRGDDGLVLVPTDRVVTVAAEGERLIITTTDRGQHTILYRLKDLEARLDPGEFVRLNRSVIVSLNAVKRLIRTPGGSIRVVLENGQELGMSRKQTVRLRRVLQELLK